MFSLRIVNVDHYMSSPKSGLDLTYSQFRGSQVKSVPVFRIFGSTPSGKKTCLHVHGVFPYILVPYSGEDDAGKLMYQLASSLDKAINVSQNSSNSTRQHVFKIIQVSGRPFYGYHSQDHQFFKIFFYNPLVVKRACDLLQNGAVCGTKFQIHEGHVPFTLQFFIDYNLYGMSFINLKSVVFRKDASPSGITPGSLPKESCCELEADAVAVDILNRLTIEGELAVNPGLAAIWREEKERLGRDTLDVSQRPPPPRANSEVLLMERLLDNLKFQGKCKTPLKESIPYPAETQRTGSDILDASVLDTHSVSSLASAGPNPAEETACIDEELVLSLTQSSVLSSSLDQSLFMALDDLAAQNEVNAVMSQQVEDDSVLGSQMLPEDMFGNDISDGELEALNYSLPVESATSNRSEDENDEESDDNFEGDIPQLDGVGDIGGKNKKSKQSRRKRRVLVENSVNETYPLSEGEEILLNTIKDCWPESGKQETLEEIFSDEEPYNSPLNNIDDRCEPLDLEPINVDLISSFETVLRGDPSFTSGDLASEDVMFQPVDDNADNNSAEKTCFSDETIFKSNQNTNGPKPTVDKNSNIDTVPSLNTSLEATDMDKSVMLDIGGEELLDTSQLDEILNDDLNKGLEIICEKSPQQEFQENWIRSGGTSHSSEIIDGNEECLNEDMLDEECLNEEIMMIAASIESAEESAEEGELLAEVNVNPDIKNIYLDENNPLSNTLPCSAEKKETQVVNENPLLESKDCALENPLLESKDYSLKSPNKKRDSNTPQKSFGGTLKNNCSSPKKGPGNRLYIRWFSKKKIRRDITKKENLFKMTKKEINTYYAQLEKLTKYLSQRTNNEEPQPILWFPIRENFTDENLGQREKKRKRKPTKVERIMKKCKFSDDEISKMRSCIVKVHKLSKTEIRDLSGKAMVQSSTSDGQCKQHFKQDKLESKSTSSKNTNNNLNSLRSPATNFDQNISTKENVMKNSLKSSESITKNPENLKNKNTSPNSKKVVAIEIKMKSGKHKRCNIEKSQSPNKPSLTALDKVSGLQLPNIESTSVLDIAPELSSNQNITTQSSKKRKKFKGIQVDKIQQNKGKSGISKDKRQDNPDITGSESSIKSEKKNKSNNIVKSKEIERHDVPSLAKVEPALIKDQSPSLKLNKECTIILSPISHSVTEALPKSNCVDINEISESSSLDKVSNAALESVCSKSDGMLIPLKFSVENNRNPLVKVEKLVTSCHFSDSIAIPEKKIKCDVGSKKQLSSATKESNLQENESMDKSNCRKRLLRIYSLDGTADNSSSDENTEGKESIDKPSDTAANYSTPNKRRKSKTCRSPRNYVPLSIEIKKSPKAKPKDKTKGIVKHLNGREFAGEHKYDFAITKEFEDSKSLETPNSSKCKSSMERLPVTTAFHSNPCSSDPVQRSQPQDFSSLEKSTSSECHVKSKHLDPHVSVERLPLTLDSRSGLSDSVVKNQLKGSTGVEEDSSKNLTESQLKNPLVSIKRLPSMTDLQSGLSDTVDVRQPKASTSAQPLVKRLKVYVNRLSLDTQGDLLKHDRVTKLKKRTHRSFSLPISCEEKACSPQSIRCNSKSKLGVKFCETGDESKSNDALTDKGKKVRKALLFPAQEESHCNSGGMPSIPTLKNKPIPERKLSTDLFDGNSTPEHHTTSNCSGSSSGFQQLSGITRRNTSDLEDDTLISESPMDNTILSLNLSDCSSENIGVKVNRNPHELENPTLFTPALYPPTRSEVLARLKDCGLPEVVNEGAFYSDPADVSKSCEVGSTVLKLQSKSVIHMEEFIGSFGSLSKWKMDSLKKIPYKSWRKESKIICITPLKPPPTQLQAKEWLKSKLEKKCKEVSEAKKVKKILLPASPGNGDFDDDECDSVDDSMTISQCTPVSEKSVKESITSDCAHTTPEVVVSKSSNISPLMSSTPVNSQLKLSAVKRRFSRPSSGFRKSLPLIKEENQDGIEEYVNLHHNETNSQTATVFDNMKLSESGIKRLLSESKSPASLSCQIDMVTPNNSGNYRLELENLQDVKIIQEHQHLTILSVELHVHTRGELRPNPDLDAICCIFYNITNDYPDPSISTVTGAIYVSDDGKEEKMPQFKCELQAVPSESALIAAFLDLVRKWDPDIFVGYEIELLSWGYLLQRAYVLNVNLAAQLSRVSRPGEGREGDAREVGDDDSEIRLTGRIVLNLWRFLRHEVALQSYTFENIMYHVLHQRVPLFSFRTLTSWWAHRTKLYRWLVFEHYFTRVEGMAKIMKHVDLVVRTSEFARLFGIQFYEVLSRGSQFRVESMMLRLVKPLNYVAVSPSVQQRARMRAPESLPLIMEPQSRFYTDPVIVLDFQSLYPSIIIAYNYCFSTCLGRVEHLGRSELFEFGCTQLRVPVRELLRLKGSLNFAPCGVAFVDQSVVRGVLPRMLEEILNTRLMVKQSMKENKENKTLQRVLHNRQLGLKLIANVTYGYTAANFSGRMPCIEVGDSVVSKARETLERAISLVGSNKQWGARVIYGDTDSMFVLVPGRSRQEAFRIGAEIAEAVTNDNPQPVKLKLEKVYQPCLLQTKKRYVGYMYESPNQEEPVYDAKGIETVRRDGCPAVAKVLEKSLRLLFETRDVSLVKRFVCRQFAKVLSGRVSVQDLTFAREYRGAAGYRPGACVPALELAKQGCALDPRSEPRVGQRVPYVVVAGAPGLPLIRLVRPPSALLHDPGLRVNAEYYITRVIAPPLDRCFSLLGAQVAAWYAELPRKQHLHLPTMEGPRAGGRKATISQYFATCGCVACGQLTSRGVCDECRQRPQQLSVTLATQVLGWERRLTLVTNLCQSCCGRGYETDCTSLDCPVLYRLCQARKDLRQADYVRSLQDEFLSF